MTTIFVDQKMGYMAADRMATANDGEIAMECVTKIEQIEIGGDLYLVGLSGLESSGQIFLDWFEDGEWDDPPGPVEVEEGDEFSVVVLSPNGIEVADRYCRLTPIKHRWYAIGSGGIFAWAILEAGCGRQKAMETAIKMDPNSGFGYDIIFLDGTHEEVEAVDS